MDPLVRKVWLAVREWKHDFTAMEAGNATVCWSGPTPFPLTRKLAHATCKTLEHFQALDRVRNSPALWRVAAEYLEFGLPPAYVLDVVSDRIYTDVWQASGGPVVLHRYGEMVRGSLTLRVGLRAKLPEPPKEVDLTFVGDRYSSGFEWGTVAAPIVFAEVVAKFLGDLSYIGHR